MFAAANLTGPIFPRSYDARRGIRLYTGAAYAFQARPHGSHWPGRLTKHGGVHRVQTKFAVVSSLLVRLFGNKGLCNTRFPILDSHKANNGCGLPLLRQRSGRLAEEETWQR